MPECEIRAAYSVSVVSVCYSTQDTHNLCSWPSVLSLSGIRTILVFYLVTALDAALPR